MPCAHRSLLALSLSLALTTVAAAAPPMVTVENHTRPTLCAEEDNVSLTLRAAGVRRFTVEALQPAYLDRIDRDTTAPDFSNCNFDGGAHPTDPSFQFTPRRVVLHDGAQWQIVGMALPSFWRPAEVPVRVGALRDKGFHLIQVFAKDASGGKPLEALVMYPADGYWRLKPLPLPRFDDGVYGSSFVMGPIVDAGRPVADIVSIEIDAKPLAFRLAFADGSRADIRVTEVSRKRTAMTVTMTPATTHARPFAVLRSMYVAPDNADMSEVRWKRGARATPQTLALPDVSTLQATDVQFGRALPSKHNTSAPDLRFSDFRGDARTGRAAY